MNEKQFPSQKKKWYERTFPSIHYICISVDTPIKKIDENDNNSRANHISVQKLRRLICVEAYFELAKALNRLQQQNNNNNNNKNRFRTNKNANYVVVLI